MIFLYTKKRSKFKFPLQMHLSSCIQSFWSSGNHCVCLCMVCAGCVMTWQAESTALSDKLHYSIPSPDLSLSCFTLLIPIGGCKPRRQLGSSHKILPLWAAEAGEPEVPFVCRCTDCDLPKYLGNNGLLLRDAWRGEFRIRAERQVTAHGADLWTKAVMLLTSVF